MPAFYQGSAPKARIAANNHYTIMSIDYVDIKENMTGAYGATLLVRAVAAPAAAAGEGKRGETCFVAIKARARMTCAKAG